LIRRSLDWLGLPGLVGLGHRHPDMAPQGELIERPVEPAVLPGTQEHAPEPVATSQATSARRSWLSALWRCCQLAMATPR